MEQNLPVIAKKFWNIVRVAFFMLRKGISSKRKLMLDLNLMMKRGKIASKAAIQNLMFHHMSAIHRRSHDNNTNNLPFSPPHNHNDYYEFSCNNSPAYRNFHLPNFNFNKRKNRNRTSAATLENNDDVIVVNAAVMKAFEMLQSETASPAGNNLPGFGRTPLVRQLRVTDSPFPLGDVDQADCHVDEAAEEFISKFYRNLRWQASPCA